MNRNFLIFLSVLTGAMLTACSNEEEAKEMPAEGLPMMVEVSETPLTDADNGQPVNASTRGDVITSTGFNSFNMSYGGCGETKPIYTANKNNEGVWIVEGNWPSDHARNYSFYAYNYGTFIDEVSPYVSFTVDGTPANQYDLLVANTTTSRTACSGTVPLSFKHACAAVRFNIGQSSTLKGKNITFTEITLVGVCNSGDYHFNTATWTVLADPASFTLESASNISIPVSSTSHVGARPLSCSHLFMIPQTLGASAKLVITYSGGTQSSAEISLNNETWEAGKRYTYNIRLGTTLIK
ncbi:MAG: fimbrillin family protein [Bacteroidaceae bacterium]|nr:fimbrillin family protein [Bacteroidaceae bacterium]